MVSRLLAMAFVLPLTFLQQKVVWDIPQQQVTQRMIIQLSKLRWCKKVRTMILLPQHQPARTPQLSCWFRGIANSPIVADSVMVSLSSLAGILRQMLVILRVSVYGGPTNSDLGYTLWGSRALKLQRWSTLIIWQGRRLGGDGAPTKYPQQSAP